MARTLVVLNRHPVTSLLITRQQLQTIRRRHLGYRILLVYQILLLLLMPLSRLFRPLLPLLLIGLAMVLMVFLNRFSRLPRSVPVIAVLGSAAIALELIWYVALAWDADLGRLITLPHVVVWLLFLLVVVVRGVRALMREPFITLSVLQGAASGYLNLGIAGGVMLNAVWVLQPSAFVASALPPQLTSAGMNAELASALMAASFGLLASIGTQVLDSRNVMIQVLASLITISGQLYLAILIGLILGRVHRRLG